MRKRKKERNKQTEKERNTADICILVKKNNFTLYSKHIVKQVLAKYIFSIFENKYYAED